MRQLRTVLVISVLLSFFSCSRKEMVVITDLWWGHLYENAGNVIDKSILFSYFPWKKKITHYEFSSVDELNELLESISNNDSIHSIVLTPLLYKEIEVSYIGKKKINYILINGFYDNPADNVKAVYSNREEIYFQAGVLAAEYSEKNGSSAVAAVFYVGTDAAVLEKSRFVEGYESIEYAGELLQFEQSSNAGNDSIEEFINSAPGKGAGLFFFSASSINPFCLEQAYPLALPISGENLNSLGSYNDLVEFSIDNDMIEIVKTAIKLGLDGEEINDVPVKPLLRVKGIDF